MALCNVNVRSGSCKVVFYNGFERTSQEIESHQYRGRERLSKLRLSITTLAGTFLKVTLLKEFSQIHNPVHMILDLGGWNPAIVLQ